MLHYGALCVTVVHSVALERYTYIISIIYVLVLKATLIILKRSLVLVKLLFDNLLPVQLLYFILLKSYQVHFFNYVNFKQVVVYSFSELFLS